MTAFEKPENWTEFANRFPLLEGEELEAMVRSIQRDGQIVPVVLVNGKVLDGRNRAIACAQLGIEVKTFEAGSVAKGLQWVEGLNVIRRHLTTSQRLIIAAALSEAYAAEASARQAATRSKPGERADQRSASPNSDPRSSKGVTEAGKAVSQAARQVSVSTSSTFEAKSILKADPVVAKQILDGKMTVNQGTQEVKRRANERRGIRPLTKEDKQRDDLFAWWERVLAEMPAKARQGGRLTQKQVESVIRQLKRTITELEKIS